MKPPEELDMDVLYEDAHYINTLLSRHCLHSGNDSNVLEDNAVPSDRSSRDYSHFNERRDANHDLKHPLNRSSIAKSDVASALHSFENNSITLNGIKRDVPSTVQLLSQLNRLNGHIWLIAEDLQNNATYNVHQFVQNVRGSMKNKTPYDYNELADSLRKCESIVGSVSRKCDKTRSLQILEQLEGVIKLNIKAVALIHNWDDTLKKIRILFDKYYTFCGLPSEERLSQLFQKDSNDFNYKNIIEIRDVLLQLKESKLIYACNSAHYNNMEQVLDEFISDYTNILDDISSELAHRFFAPCGQQQEGDTEMRSEEFEQILHLYLELHNDLFDPDEAVRILLGDLSSSINGMFSQEFTNLWEEFSSMDYYEEIENSDEDAIELITSSLCDIIRNYIGIFADTVNTRMPLFKLLFSKMDSDGLLKHHNKRISPFVADICKSSLELLEILEGDLFGMSDGMFLKTVTTILSTLERNVDEKLATLDEVDIKDDLSQMKILPSETLHNYVRTLFSSTERTTFVCNPKDGAPCLEFLMKDYEEMIEHVGSLKPAENGFLMSTNEPTGYHGFSWVYNRCVLWQLKSTYHTLMLDLFHHVDDHLVNLRQKDVPKDSSTGVEDECRDLLSSMLDKSARLMDIVRFGLIPTIHVLSNGNTLCKSIAHAFKEDTMDSFYYLPEDLCSYICEVDATVSTESFFSADCNVIDNAVSHIVEYIANRASLLISEYYSKGYATLSPMSIDEEPQESRTILLVGEYFTLLLSRFSEGDMLSLKIMGKAYTKFIDAELERLARTRPSDVTSRRCYRADVEHLILISNYCCADVADSLELLLEGC